MEKSKLDTKSRRIARCRGFDIGVDLDHPGHVTIFGTFHSSALCQGLGRIIEDVDFIKKFLAVFNVEKFSQLEGRACWVTENQSGIIALIEPLLPDEGTSFNLED